MKKVSIFVALLLASFSITLATVGGPNSISNIYYSPQKNEIRYIFNRGGEITPPDSESSMSYQLATGKIQELEHGATYNQQPGDNITDDSYEKGVQSWDTYKKDFLEKQTVALKKVDLNSIDLKFKTQLKEIRGVSAKNYKNEINDFAAANPSSSRDEILDYMREFIYQNTKMVWSVTPVYNAKEEPKIVVTSCIDYNGPTTGSGNAETFSAYSNSDLNFLVLVVTVVDNCSEGGYNGDQLFVIKNIDTLKVKYAMPEKDENDIMVFHGGMYQKFDGLEKMHEYLNDYGFAAYKKGDYDTATVYFDMAYTDTYVLPLYNAAATEAKTDHADSALTRLEKLLSHAETHDMYIAKINQDKDFNSLKKDARFQALLPGPTQKDSVTNAPKAPKKAVEKPAENKGIPPAVWIIILVVIGSGVMYAAVKHTSK